MIDFTGLAQRLLASAESLVPEWFPEGKRQGAEWCVGSLAGEPGSSLKINLHTGRWADFATQESGGDLISLYAAKLGVKQLEAARELNGDADRPLNGAHYAAAPRAPEPPRAPETVDAPLQRPPADAPEPSLRHYKWGDPVARYAYRDADGLLGYVARYEPAGERKQFAPWTWAGEKWVAKAFPKPRPLYGLDRLAAAKPGSTVLLVEGEKCADAIRQLVAPWVVMSWPGGARAIGTVDWEPLRGRTVNLWPDNDQAGRECMAELQSRLMGMGCSGRTVNPTGQPEGWDAADAVADGWDRELLKAWLAREGGKFIVSYQPSPAGGAGDAVHSPATADSSTATLPPTVPAPPAGAPLHVPTADERRAAALDIRQVWEMMQLDTRSTSNGVPPANEDTALRILTHVNAEFWYDEFYSKLMTRDASGVVRQIRESDDLEFLIRVQRDFKLHKMSKSAASAGLQLYAHRNRRNAAQEWMRSLVWDGVERLGAVMPIGFGTPDDAYHASVGRCFVMAMVARVLDPGCKCDYMPVLEGGQGVGKTTALQILGGDWYAENHEEFGSKDFYQALRGKMLVEISELAGFSRAEQEKIKAVITNPYDTYRKSYGREAEDIRRTCVFVGTTNRDDWIKDDTGARRFWRVNVGDMNLGWLREWRTQLFAEAVTRFTRDESYWDVDRGHAEQAAEGARDLDAWHDTISAWLMRQSEVRPDDAFDYLNVEMTRRDRSNLNRLLSIFRMNHWTSVPTKRNGVSVRVWRPTHKSPGRAAAAPVQHRIDDDDGPDIPY